MCEERLQGSTTLSGWLNDTQDTVTFEPINDYNNHSKLYHTEECSGVLHCNNWSFSEYPCQRTKDVRTCHSMSNVHLASWKDQPGSFEVSRNQGKWKFECFVFIINANMYWNLICLHKLLFHRMPLFSAMTREKFSQHQKVKIDIQKYVQCSHFIEMNTAWCAA
jgi:hypothetical protein